MPKEIAMLYRQKNRAMSFARIQSEPSRKLKRRIQNRLIAALARNASLTAAETSTLILAPLALGAILLDLWDTCANLKDLNQIKDNSNSDGDITLPKDSEGICGMSKEGFMEFVGIDVKLQICILARQESNEINPPECDGIEPNFPNYATTKPELGLEIKIPTYDGDN